MTFDTTCHEEDDHCLESPPSLPEMPLVAPVSEYEYSIFPNPGTGHFTFTQPEPRHAHLFMTDSYGRTVWQGETDRELSTFYVDVPSGIYLLNIRNEERLIEPKKLIIQR